jgi:hypothetical protein
MTEADDFAEVVLLFEPDCSAINQEIHFSEFESMVEGCGALEQYAASVVYAAFALVGNALAVQGLVFFTFRVDEDGKVDPAFNLPLRYLIEMAGAGPDLGTGPIRVACRGQCPVPWHSVNLWEPTLEGESSAVQLAQKQIWRNRLALKPKGRMGRIFEETILEDFELDAPPEAAPIDQRKLEARLTETFGEEGKVSLEHLIRQHNEKLAKVSDRYRGDLERQQQVYLDQIRNCRDEIQKLKSALRNEQQRSRRLQQLLRGEP